MVSFERMKIIDRVIHFGSILGLFERGRKEKKKVNRRIGALLRLYCAAFRDKDLLPI